MILTLFLVLWYADLLCSYNSVVFEVISANAYQTVAVTEAFVNDARINQTVLATQWGRSKTTQIYDLQQNL